jgi:hypothetical protein
MKRNWPICGVLSAKLPVLFFGAEFFGSVESDILGLYVVPIVAALLAIAAFFFRERAIWPILGLIFTAFYVGLHLIPAD